MPTDVEVQIVTYNSWPLIESCLASIDRLATRPGINVAVTVLDNASSDGTADKVATQFPRVRLLRWDNNALYGPASNALVSRSDADFVLLLNPDTELLDEIISPLVESLLSCPDADVALPSVVDTSGTRQPVVQRFPTLRYELAKMLHGTKASQALRPLWDTSAVIRATEAPDFPVGVAFSPEFLWSTCLLMRRETAERFGPFSAEFPMYDSDLDLSRRMAASGVRAIYLPHLRVRHVGGASSSRAKKMAMMLSARTRYYRRHRGPLSAGVFRVTSVAISSLKRARQRVQTSATESGGRS